MTYTKILSQPPRYNINILSSDESGKVNAEFQPNLLDTVLTTIAAPPYPETQTERS